MNREETKKAIEVMQAYVDGKTVIHKTSGELDGVSTSSVQSHWRWDNDSEIYYVKPEPIERWIALLKEATLSSKYSNIHYESEQACLLDCGEYETFVKAIKLVEEI